MADVTNPKVADYQKAFKINIIDELKGTDEGESLVIQAESSLAELQKLGKSI